MPPLPTILRAVRGIWYQRQSLSFTTRQKDIKLRPYLSPQKQLLSRYHGTYGENLVTEVPHLQNRHEATPSARNLFGIPHENPKNKNLKLSVP